MQIGPTRRIFVEIFSKQPASRKFLVIALLVVPGLWFWALHRPSQMVRPLREPQKISTSRPADDWIGVSLLTGTASSDRPVYPYSVIPGGVESRAELKRAIECDAVAAAHYAGFDVASAHVIRLASARKVYVSYRVGERIYWTRRRITLPKGETVLSDGTHLARARCGNRISETPGPDLPDEPPQEVFDRPVRPALPEWAPVDVASGPFVPFDPDVPQLAWNFPAQPGLPGNSQPFVPLFPTIPCCVGGGSARAKNPPAPPEPPMPPAPPVVTPEPSSILLLITGSLILCSIWAFRRS